MGESAIAWTGHTWNPIGGCSIASTGCIKCYAAIMARRHELMSIALDRVSPYAGLTKVVNGNVVWTGELRQLEDALTLPLRRRKPTTFFVNSMSDLFHEDIPDAWIDRVFAVMALADWHIFQVLTKRSARARAYLTHPMTPARIVMAMARITAKGTIAKMARGREIVGRMESEEAWPLPNLWMGVSCEDQRRADERVPDLMATPAAVRFVSAEPLLGPIDFCEWIERVEHCGSCGSESGPRDEDRCPSCRAENILITTWGEAQAERYRTGERYDESSAAGQSDIAGTSPMLDWIIAGGESGATARICRGEWIDAIEAQCAAAGIPFFRKQLGSKAVVADMTGWPNGGEILADRSGYRLRLRDRKGADPAEWPELMRVQQMPEAPHAG